MALEFALRITVLWVLCMKLEFILDTGITWTELSSGKVTRRTMWRADYSGERLEEERGQLEAFDII